MDQEENYYPPGITNTRVFDFLMAVDFGNYIEIEDDGENENEPGLIKIQMHDDLVDMFKESFPYEDESELINGIEEFVSISMKAFIEEEKELNS